MKLTGQRGIPRLLGWTILLLPWTLGTAQPFSPAAEVESYPFLEYVEGTLYAKDHILVQWKDSYLNNSELTLRLQSPEERAQSLGLPLGVTIHPSRFSEWVERQAQYADNPSKPRPRGSYWKCKLNGCCTAEEALLQLGGHPLLEYAERDGTGSIGAVPDDPYFSKQWHHQRIQSPQAWNITQGSSEVIVAILDTGLNFTLPEFSGRVVGGYDFVHQTPYPYDDHGHGTVITGVIAANANNAHQVAGVDWQCRILPIKILNGEGKGDTVYSYWADGIDYAVHLGAKVINLSAGGKIRSQALVGSIQRAIAQGAIFISITHNVDEISSGHEVLFPGNMEEVIAVGATDTRDVKAPFSRWGPEVDLVAPGRTIYSVNEEGRVHLYYGTSMASALVSGAAALLVSLDPSLDQKAVSNLLTVGAEDLVGNAYDTPGFDPYYGWGRLNIFHSLVLAQSRLEFSVDPEAQRIKLKWRIPTNAPSKSPYEIQQSFDLKNWGPISSPGSIRYDVTRHMAEIYIDMAESTPSGFYRLAIRP